MRTRTPRTPGRRPAFTLLELVVALSISLLLLIALYVAMNVLLGSQSRGRGLAEHSAAVRSLMGRIEKDILSELPPLDPQQNPTASQMLTGVAPSGGGSGGASGSGGSSGSGGTSGSGSSGSSATAVTTGSGVGTTGPVVFNMQLQGNKTQLTLFTSQVPTDVYRYLASSQTSNTQDQPLSSDLRRITYWLAGADGNTPLGLARQEMKVATTQDALTPFDPSQVDEAAFVLAKEVLGLQFEYFDGFEWQDTWDGTVVQSDGVTPQGPPAAIRISLTVRRANATSDDQTIMYRHVVAIPTANNFLTTADGSAGSPSGSSTPSSGSMTP